jgi:hypothetical protein
MYPTGNRGENKIASEYEKNAGRSEVFGYVLLAGLGVELVFAVILSKPWVDWISTILSDVLIVVGVWGEIHFGQRARIAGDAAQVDAEARVAEANQKAAEAAEHAATAQRELMEFRARRSISPEAMEAIAESLKQFSVPGFDVCIGAADVETFGLMDQISLICLWAEWEWLDWPIFGGFVYTNGKKLGTGNARLNVAIGHRFDAKEETKEAAKALATGLGEAGIAAYDMLLTAGPPSERDANAVHIRIGRKT